MFELGAWPVRNSPEFKRINALPRRDWDDASAMALAEALTPHLLNERGLAEWRRLSTLPAADREQEIDNLAQAVCPIRLLPHQAIALVESWQSKYKGALAALSTGQGKTLLFYAALLIHRPRRPMLITTKSLIKEAERQFEVFRTFWQEPDVPYELEHYQRLGQGPRKTRLCGCAGCQERRDGVDDGSGYRPDLLGLDEAAKLRNPQSSVSTRVIRYVKQHRVGTRVMAATGTLIRESVSDFAHIADLCLGDESPAPLDALTLEEWSGALDYAPKEGFARRPGALMLWAPAKPSVDEPRTETDLALEGYQKRLVQTPGIILNMTQSCSAPMLMRPLKTPDDPLIEKVFFDFRKEKMTPDEWPISDIFSQIAFAGQMSTGFYYYWDPRPPAEWREAFRAYNKWIREEIQMSKRRGRTPLDCESDVLREFPNHPTLLAWREIRPTFKPNTKAKWISLSAVHYAANWMNENPRSAVWVLHTEVGAMLSKLTGWSFYSKGGCDANKRHITEAPKNEGVILSLSACREGLNLQFLESNLVVTPPSSEEWWEQFLARIHRRGRKDPVRTDIMIGASDSLRALERALGTSEHVQKLSGFQQKIRLAEWDWSQYPFHELQQLPDEDIRRARWSLFDE